MWGEGKRKGEDRQTEPGAATRRPKGILDPPTKLVGFYREEQPSSLGWRVWGWGAAYGKKTL